MAQITIHVKDVVATEAVPATETSPGIPAGAEGLTIEVFSNEVNNHESMANKFGAWLAAHTNELLMLFRAQLAAFEQERTGDAPVATAPGPQILGADGRPANTDIVAANGG